MNKINQNNVNFSNVTKSLLGILFLIIIGVGYLIYSGTLFNTKNDNQLACTITNNPQIYDTNDENVSEWKSEIIMSFDKQGKMIALDKIDTLQYRTQSEYDLSKNNPTNFFCKLYGLETELEGKTENNDQKLIIKSVCSGKSSENAQLKVYFETMGTTKEEIKKKYSSSGYICK